MPTDFDFTFDPTQFLEAFTKITNAIDGVTEKISSVVNVSNNKLSSVQTSTVSVAKGFILANVAMSVFRSGMNAFPEIGRTFDVAGDIIQRSLLWPLRQELIPILQTFLD